MILLGKILSPHGVKGQVKVWSYAEFPYNLIAYGPLTDKSGKRVFKLSLEGQAGGALIATVEGVADRDAAERLRGTELFVPRCAFPDPAQGQYYQSDLVGTPVVTEDGAPFGTLGAFHNFGAGVIAEIRFADGKSEMYAFTEKNFPTIDPANHRITINPPEEIES